MRPTLNDIVSEIRDWKVEANSWRNDGWTKEHYISMLEKVKKELENVNYNDIAAGLQKEVL